MAIIVAPLYVTLLLALVSVLAQFRGDFLLVGAVACYVGGPSIYILNAKQLVQPCGSAESMRSVRRLRTYAGVSIGAGIALFAIHLVRLQSVPVLTGVEFVAGVAGNTLLTTVVASDLLLAMFVADHSRTRLLAGSDTDVRLSDRYRGLANAGFGGALYGGEAEAN